MYRLHRADALGLNKILAVEPVLHDYILADELINKNDRIILHAGPAFKSPEDISVPILNSACAASVFSGMAKSFIDAEQLIDKHQITLQPAQDYNVVVPLAGVVSPSMWLYKIVDAKNPENVVYAPLNGGDGPAMRLGLANLDVVEHLSWINSELIEFFLKFPRKL